MRRRFLPIISFVLTVAACAGPAAADDRNPLSVLARANENIERRVLDNGMVCLVKEDHSAPVVAVQIWVGVGSIHEGRYLGSGLCHAIEHMIFKGTTNRAVGEVTKEINRAGGKVNAYTSFDRTVFHAVMPAAKWKVGLEVFGDALMRPALPEEEWRKERNVILREMAMGRDNPQRVLGKLAWQTAFTAHPYRHPIIGYEDVFRKRTRDDLYTFLRDNYVPDNMITVITGDVDADEAFAAIHDVFDGFERRARAPAVLPTEPDQVSPRFQRKTGAYEVSRLEWMYPAVPLQHPDAPALDMLAAIVGRGKSSRLVRELKERRQLVFEINAWAWTPKEAGIFGISATFDPEKEDAVRDAIANEINSWQNDAFEQEEIDKARRMLLVSELSDLETMDGQAGSIGAGAFYAGDPRFSERYIERLQAVTPETLSRVAKAYLDPQKVNLAILSPDLPQPGKSDTEEAAATALPPTRFELPNGVRLVVREDRRLPFVYMCTASRGGLLSETEENNGITRLMTELLVRGTEQYGAEEIAGQVEQLGASLTSYSGDNSFGLRARCLSSDTETVFNLLADSLLHPTFPDDEVAKQKALQAAAIRRQHEDPFFLARKALRASLFGAHPYHMLAVGDTNAVEKLTREQLQQHYANLLKPDNLVISLFGDISTEEARQLAEQAFARLAMETKTGDELQSVPEVVTKRAEQRVPRDQAILLVGYTGLEVDDPRADAMTLIQEAMSGLSSTLGAEVREKRGLVYYVGAFQRLGLDPGTFALYGGTTEEAVPELERLMGEEVARIRREGLGPEELELARAELLGKHQMNLQDTADLAQLCALNELYGVGYDHVFSFEKRIRAVTNEDIIDAAGDILIDEHKAVSVVLPELNKESEAKEDDD